LASGEPGFGAILFLLFLLEFALLFSPGLFGVIFGSSFFFFGLSNWLKSIFCPVRVAPESF
jgi:hypothetical protein